MTQMTADVVTSCRELQGESEILRYLLRYATLTGRDALGRSTISLPLNDWLFDQLSALNDNAQHQKNWGPPLAR
jgi:hypothetical protein